MATSTRGRKKKPTAEKVRNGSAAKDPQRLNKSEPAAVKDEPTKPDWLDDFASAEWDRVTGLMREMGYLSATYQSALESYVQTYSDWRTAVEQVKQSGMVVYGKRNQWQVEVRNARGDLMKLLSEFGLTPSSKSRVSGDGPKELDPLTEILKRRQTMN